MTDRRRGSRTIRVSPKVATGLSDYRRAELASQVEGGILREGATYNASQLVKTAGGQQQQKPAGLAFEGPEYKRGVWGEAVQGSVTSGSYRQGGGHVYRGSSPAAVGAIVHSSDFKREGIQKIASSGLGFGSTTGNLTSSGGAAGAAGVDRLAPEVYSPLFMMANLNLPRERITVNSWCFLPDTLVWMADGTRKPICEIKIGDTVMSASGTPRRVTTLFRREVNEEIVGIKVKGGQDVVWATTNHGFEVANKEDVRCVGEKHYMKCKPTGEECFCERCKRVEDPYTFQKTPAGEIERYDAVYMPVFSENNDLEISERNKLLFEYLGYYTAEGNTNKSRGVYFNLGIHETELANRIVFLHKTLFNDFSTEPIIRKRHKRGNIQVECRSKVANNLCVDLCGKLAHKKKLSTDIISAPKELLICFLKAWFDGDGGQEKCNYNVFCGNTSSRHLAEQMRVVAGKCGLVAHVMGYENSSSAKLIQSQLCNVKPRFYVKIRGNSAIKFGQHFAGNFYRFSTLSRKRNRDGCSFIHNDKIIQYVEKINKQQYEGTVYNIEVEEEHTYVVGYGVAVHNCRNFYDLHPIVRNAITLHATYPISKLNLKCHNKEVLQFFEDMVEDMNLMEGLGMLALEFWKLGEAFPFLELDEGTGKWSRMVIHNPDYIHVKKTVLAGESLISMKADAVLQRLVMSNNPADVQIRKQIPEDIQYYVRKGQPIPLDSFNISHLKMLAAPYDVRGTSVIVSVFKDLMLYDKLREAKFAQADGLVNPLTVIKVGGNTDGDYRATQEDLDFFKQILEEAQYDKDFKLVTHAGVDISRVGSSGAVLDVAADFEMIMKNIYTGLMVPPSVVDSDSSSYNSASIGLEVLRQRYFNFRNMLANWLQNKVFAPIADLHNFAEYKDGTRRLIVPDVEWNQMNLYDLQDYIGNITVLLSNNQISLQTVYKSLGVSYEDERMKQRQEMIDQAISLKEQEAISTMSLTELRGLDPEKPINEPVDSKERPKAQQPDAGGMLGGDMGGLGDLGGGGMPGGDMGGMPELAPPPGGDLGGAPPGPAGGPEGPAGPGV